MSLPSLVPAVLPLLSLLPQQAPTQDEEPIPLPPVFQLRQEIQERLSTEIVGAWRLDVFVEDGIPAPNGSFTGNVLFCDGYMSLIIHAIGFDEIVQDDVAQAQAGIFRYQVDGFSALQTATVIGHSAEEDDFEFESVGVLREYELQVEGDLMRLEHRLGTSFSLSRILDDAETGALAMVDALRAFGKEEGERAPLEELAADQPLSALMQARMEEIEKVRDGIRGAWSLSKYIQDGEIVPPGEVEGIATWCDGYMSLVIHAYGYDYLIEEEVLLGQAGIFLYRIDDFGDLVTSTVTGHSNPDDGIEYEDFGDLRTYRVRLEENVLTLTHEEGTELVFARMPPASFSDRDRERLDRLRGRESLGVVDEVEDEGE
jgi:hypothetical protein